MQLLLWFKEAKLVLNLSLLFFHVRLEKVDVGSITLLKRVKVCVGVRMPGFELDGDIESKVSKKD